MVSSLSPAGLVHCPAASAETALCPAHHPPAAADTGSSSSRRLKTSQTSPNLHTTPLSDLQTPTETESGWKSEFLNKPRAQIWISFCASQNCRKLCICASLIRGAAEWGILEKRAGMRKKKVQSQEEDAGFGWHQGVVFLFDSCCYYVLIYGHTWCFLWWMIMCDCIIIEIWMRKFLNAQKKTTTFHTSLMHFFSTPRRILSFFWNFMHICNLHHIITSQMGY